MDHRPSNPFGPPPGLHNTHTSGRTDTQRNIERNIPDNSSQYSSSQSHFRSDVSSSLTSNNNFSASPSTNALESPTLRDPIDILFPKTQSLLSRLNTQVADLEHLRAVCENASGNPLQTSAVQSRSLSSSILSPEQLDQLKRSAHSIRLEVEKATTFIERLSTLSNQQPPAVRALWNARIQNLQRQSQDIHTAIQKYSTQAIEHKKSIEIRKVLFSGLSNNPTDEDDQDGDPEQGFASNYREANLHAREKEGLISASNAIDKVLGAAQHSMESLLRQKANIKGLQRRMLDAANILGVSHHVFRLIDRKENMNSVLAYGCMIFTFIVILLVWYLW